MNKFFIYTRVSQVRKTDENGQAIPSKDEKGDVIPNKFETEPKEFIDAFNLNKVIRVHMISEDHAIVLLDDGHEVTEVTPELKNPNKPPQPNNIIEVKKRVWQQSEISVKGAEVKQLFDALRQA